MRRLGTVILAVAAVAVLGACERSRNVLVFGTDTIVALDVSGDASGTPGLTLGYKRREAVWLPLASDDKADAEFTAGPDGRDAYSVLASFGLETTADGPAIAQFFATGDAARALAQSGGAALVSPLPSAQPATSPEAGTTPPQSAAPAPQPPAAAPSAPVERVD
ncbi:MAG: hypothetical protein NXI21_03265 [Alphaproteobacteria bacterium]|nr:hypothetical protein [Alphaproteobacteria bacterium]